MVKRIFSEAAHLGGGIPWWHSCNIKVEGKARLITRKQNTQGDCHPSGEEPDGLRWREGGFHRGTFKGGITVKGFLKQEGKKQGEV